MKKVGKKQKKDKEKVGNDGHTPFGRIHNAEAAVARGNNNHRRSIMNRIGPIEKHIGRLKRSCKILKSGVVSYNKINEYIGLCCSLMNLSTKMEWMVNCGFVEPNYLNEEWVRNHDFFITDVSFY